MLSNASEPSFAESVLLVIIRVTFYTSNCEIFFHNQITIYKMASLKNIVTSLKIIVLCYSYCAYDENDTFELQPWNCPLAPLWLKWWPICKILSYALKSSFSFIYLVLIIRATLGSCECKILAEPHYCPKGDNFAKHCQTPHNHRS